MEFSADTKSPSKQPPTGFGWRRRTWSLAFARFAQHKSRYRAALPHRRGDSSESSDPFPKRRSMSVLWRTTGFRSAPVDPSSSWRRLPRIISRRYPTFPKHWLRCRLACWPG
jgi:hypothetical protein